MEVILIFIGALIIVGLALAAKANTDSKTATILSYADELLEARRLALPPIHLGFVDRKKWDKEKRQFLFAHFGW